MKKMLGIIAIMGLSVALLVSFAFAQDISLDQAKILVETYNSDPKPLSLKKFGEAFLALAESQEGQKNYESALGNYLTASKIFNDIIEAQKDREYEERKSIKYFNYIMPVFKKRDFSLFKAAKMELKLGQATKARDDFLAVIRSSGTKSKRSYVQETLGILKEQFDIDEEDLKDLGIGNL